MSTKWSTEIRKPQRTKALLVEIANAQGVDPDRCKRWTAEAKLLLAPTPKKRPPARVGVIRSSALYGPCPRGHHSCLLPRCWLNR